MNRSPTSSPQRRRSRILPDAGPRDEAVFAIKAEIADPDAKHVRFAAQKTMYGGRFIGEGDTIFLFASETEGGRGLVARGVVTCAFDVPRQAGRLRQTPRVTIDVHSTAAAARSLGRRELKPFDAWDDGRPETELNFKFYRQATNKIVGLSPEAARFLDGFFDDDGTDAIGA